MIIDALKFVRGAVSTKDLVPSMKHMVIRNGRVCAFNGRTAISSPIEGNTLADCAPRAVDMINAIQNCGVGETVSVNITGANRLCISNGTFRAYVDCLELEGLPDHQPQGEMVPINGAVIMKAFARLTDFVGNDATPEREWTNGVVLIDNCAYATNNVCLVQHYLGDGVHIPREVNVPMTAINEMKRVGEPPTHAQMCDHTITFHYADGRWIRTNLFSKMYDKRLFEVLQAAADPAQCFPIAPELAENLPKLKPFLEKSKRVYFRAGGVYTTTENEIGASFNVEGLHEDGVYSHPMLQLVVNHAKVINFAKYPEPIPFFGDQLRGLMMGQIR